MYNISRVRIEANNRVLFLSNGLNPDPGRRFLGSDLGPNCLQRLPADGKSSVYQGMSKCIF